MTNGRTRVAATVLTAAAAAAAWLGPWPAAARASDDPLGQAGEAARHVNFSGQVRVRWNDRGGEHVAELAVSASDGVVDVDGPHTVMVDERGRLVRDEQGWALLWPAAAAPIEAGLPDLSRKYQETETTGPAVAGRQTTEVVLSIGGQPRQVVDLDTATRLVLARTVLNPDGSTVRAVRFDWLDVTTPAVAPARPSTPRNARPRATPAQRLAAPYQAPAELASGYRRVGAWRLQDGLDVLYSDGLSNLSVFETPGSLARNRLPRGGTAVAVGRTAGVTWTWPGGQVTTWQDGPTVYTVVGDGPPSEVVAAASSLPATPPVSWSQRLRHACRRLIGELAGW